MSSNQFPWKLGIVFTLLLKVLLLSSCTHAGPDKHGLHTGDLAYIPARIAVLPCRKWPELASYRNMPLSLPMEQERITVCEAFDRFVVEGFQGQPYMRGLSPAVVLALLERAERTDLIADIDELWRRQPSDCSRCASPAAYYHQAIAQRSSWLTWLSTFSRAAFNSDAILVPYVIYVHEGRGDERGLRVSYRRAEVALLLIDTNTGALIWSGGREAQSRQHLPSAEAGPEQPALPEWSELIGRLLIDEIWQQFPGRQNY